jgi:ABC-type transporter Mla subunit MlaD
MQSVLDPTRSVRRLALIGAAVLAAITGVIATTSRGASTGPYEVRAIFDNAAFAVTREDVRIAGAPVGSIKALDVTPDKKAAVTISIDDARFTPFHANATCSIRPQSLIGEKYVDCDPGTSGSQPLQRIPAGSAGAGSYLLPVSQTHSPVDLDIVQDISRQPTRQALTILISELGTGLAARGADLAAVIHRANPALGRTDQVFQILARQNRELAQLATDSDTVLGPLAQERQRIADFVVQARRTSDASAARAADIARTLNRFPTFLRQLQPLMVDLGTLADQGTPLLSDLHSSATGLRAAFANLTPFANAARPAVVKLGSAATRSQGPLLASLPLAQRLRGLGNQAAPAGALLDQLTASVDRTGGIERLMDLLFFGATASNGFDSRGHYARLQLLVSPCTNYATAPVTGCSANFSGGAGTGAAADASSTTPASAPSRPPSTAASSTTPATATAKAASADRVQRLLQYLIGGRS